jgi:hypothetical protein
MNIFENLLTFVSTESIGRAIVFALLGGIMLTQWLKFQMPDWTSDRMHKFVVRLLSTLLTGFLCWVLWPEDSPWVRGAFSMIVGLASPTMYWLAVKGVYHFMPWTENVLSARPGTDDNHEHA